MDFIEWLESEMEKRAWRPADLASVAGLYPATLGRIVNRERQAGPDVCNAIARALKVPPEDVFRRAGLLPELPAPENDVTFKELLSYMRRLSESERREVLDYAAFRYRRAEGKHERGSSAGADDHSTATETAH